MLSTLSRRVARRGAFSFAHPGPWALFLLVLIVVLNGCGLLVYRASHPHQSASLQSWNYLDSDVFKLITGSLVLPLLVFLVEGRFNIAETIRKNREERAQKTQDERQQWRLEAVERSSQTWNDLYGLATEVVFWQPDKNLSELRTRISTFLSRAEEVINSWPIRFPSVYEVVNVESVVLPHLNTLLLCVNSVAYYLGETDDPAERAELQGTLAVIQDGVKTASHHPTLTLLISALNLETLRDSRRLDSAVQTDQSEESRLMTEIEAIGAALEAWVEAIAKMQATAEPMPILNGAEIDAFREIHGTARDWLRENPDRTLVDYEDYETFRESFGAIPHSQLMRAYNVAYSKEWLREFADWFALDAYSRELEESAHAPT